MPSKRAKQARGTCGVRKGQDEREEESALEQRGIRMRREVLIARVVRKLA